jgi:hypothetical protein
MVSSYQQLHVSAFLEAIFMFLKELNHCRLKPKSCKLRWKRGKKLKLLQSYARYIVRLVWCASVCLLMDSLITSSVICPLAALKYPLPQKRLPQYIFFSSGNSCWTLREDLPLALWTKSLTAIWGRSTTNKCKWSDDITPFSILIPIDKLIQYASITCILY